MTSTVPTLFEISIKAVQTKRLREVEELDDEHEEKLRNIADAQLRKCRNSQEYEQLQRAREELTKATLSYNWIEAEAKEERRILEEEAEELFTEKKKQLLATHDSDALSNLMMVQQLDGTFLPRTCIHCRQTFSSPFLPPCSTITPEGLDCANAGPGVQTCGCRVQRCKICEEPTCSECQECHMYLCRLRCGFYRDKICYVPHQVLKDGTVIKESRRSNDTALPKAYCHELPKSGYIENPKRHYSSNVIRMADHYGVSYEERQEICNKSDCEESFCGDCYETHMKVLLEQCKCGGLRGFLIYDQHYECVCKTAPSCSACPAWAEEKGAILRASRPDFKTQQLNYYRYDPEITPNSRLVSGGKEGMYEIPSNPHHSRPDPKAFFD